MNIEILLDDQSAVKVELDLSMVARLVKHALQVDANTRSTPATESQIRDLLSRIDPRSVQFLQEIAATSNGSITWRRMRSIFGISERHDWASYSGSFGKGITRAYRNILDDRLAKLVWWIDADWDIADWDDDMCAVFIDGPALDSLRSATAN